MNRFTTINILDCNLSEDIAMYTQRELGYMAAYEACNEAEITHQLVPERYFKVVRKRLQAQGYYVEGDFKLGAMEATDDFVRTHKRIMFYSHV